jgi:ankyrin repeat protein
MDRNSLTIELNKECEKGFKYVNIDTIISLVEQGADPNLVFYTVDNYSVFSSQTFTCDNNVKYSSIEVMTPLMHICQKGDTEKAKFLISKGADPHVYVFGESALMLSCREKHMETIKFLVEECHVDFLKGEPEEYPFEGHPLVYAVLAKDYKLAKYFLGCIKE